ncbi:zinc metallopeptidase [Shewanella sp. JM162201]|uniref:Zinc metallopeptidase n=1 Tax=Shewanella jiangmenensis TaxID=2837387 RepID=A0ABS5V8A1_9GAMM|nr:neutral zinc metallopeptidase [Shewanella jiangmenensis]MBT1446165.1 zinc metallopeptidase [Shewanella jiangmenensis]
MRWQGRRESSNVEDRRGQQPAMAGTGGASMLPLLLGLVRTKTGRMLLLVGVVVMLVLGQNPLNLLAPQGQQVITTEGDTKAYQTEADFVKVILAETEDFWRAEFTSQGMQYREPTLVMFTGATQTQCGMGQAAMGPFYCPPDEKVYIDLSFFRQMKTDLKAGGDFAQAYVIAHEVAHHVQNLLDISDKVHRAQQGSSKVEGNKLSVKLELQADCLAGYWGADAERKGLLERGDFEEAITAAKAIGDDTLQKNATGRVMPEKFTHGSSAERMRWFDTGFKASSMGACDTFGR